MAMFKEEIDVLIQDFTNISIWAHFACPAIKNRNIKGQLSNWRNTPKSAYTDVILQDLVIINESPIYQRISKV